MWRGGGGWIRTSVAVKREIYSLVDLTTLPPLRGSAVGNSAPKKPRSLTRPRAKPIEASTRGARFIVTMDQPRNHRRQGSGAKPQQPRKRPPHPHRPATFEEGGDVWIWGLHAAAAALANPMRKVRQALATAAALEKLGLKETEDLHNLRIAEAGELDARLPDGAVHQGLAVRTAPLEPLRIENLLTQPNRPLVILDQVTDPQNVGAIFRSAAAFGFGGVVMQTRHAPLLGGALAKAAAGAIELIPEVRAVNISRVIADLVSAGWRVIGLDGASITSLRSAVSGPGPLAIVLGAEGAGLRPSVAEACSALARIEIDGQIESLNVSNAAAICFYELTQSH